MKNTIRFAAFVLSLTLSSCGGGEHSTTDTGSASFGLTFEEAPAAMKLAPSMAPADICTSYGIDSISGTVYNSSNTAIASGGPWACADHQGTINNIPAGSNLRITIKGTVAGSVVWQGETTGVTIYAGQDTNVGTMTMTYTTPTAPTGVSATAGDSQVEITWTASTGATSYNIYWSTTTGVTKASGTRIYHATSPYIHTGLNGTIYYYVVTAVNIYGESTESGEISAIAGLPTASPLASGLSGSQGITVDSTNVYWTETSGSGTSGSVKKVSKNGGTVTTLASGLSGPCNIVVDSTNVYWTEYSGGNVKKVNINGGTVTTLASGVLFPESIAVDSTNVYWGEYGNVKKVGINDGTITTLASGLSFTYSIAVDSTSVYYSNYGNINKVGIDGGSLTTLVAGSPSNGVVGITVDSTNVYWIGAGTGTVSKIGINGGTITTFESGLDLSGGIAVDSASIYWTGAGAIKKVGISGGSVITLASGLNASPQRIVVDSTDAYWSDGSTIKKMPK